MLVVTVVLVVIIVAVAVVIVVQVVVVVVMLREYQIANVRVIYHAYAYIAALRAKKKTGGDMHMLCPIGR